MRTWTGLAMTAAIVVLCLPGWVHAAGPAEQVGWSVSAGPAQIPQGPPVEFNVTGPANTTFVLQVDAQPFNYSAPVFEAQANTSAPINSSVGWAVMTMPSSTVPAQLYQVSIVVHQVAANRTYFLLVPAFNATNQEAEIGQLQLELAQDENRITYQGELIDSQGKILNAFYVIIPSALLIMGSLVLYARYGPVVTSRIHALWAWLHHVAFWTTSPPGFTNNAAGPPPDYVEAVVPQKRFSGNLCRECRGLWTEAGIVNHLVQRHRNVLGPAGPVLGTHYVLDREAVRRERAAAITTDKRGARFDRKLTRARRTVPISEVL